MARTNETCPHCSAEYTVWMDGDCPKCEDSEEGVCAACYTWEHHGNAYCVENLPKKERCQVPNCGCMGSYPETPEERALYGMYVIDEDCEPLWCLKECVVEYYKMILEDYQDSWDDEMLGWYKQQLGKLSE